MATYKLPETNTGVVTSWMPITTAYPSRADCNDIYWSYVPNTIAAWDPGYGISVTDSSCLPKPMTTWWDQSRLGENSATVMSVGPITCPQAFYTAQSSVKDESSTMIACCPSGYTFSEFSSQGLTGECFTNVDVGKVITYATLGQGGWTHSTLTITAPTTFAGVHLNGWTFATPTTTSMTSSPATMNGTHAASNGGLSAGAKAGIAVGVVMGAIGLITLAVAALMLHRARRKPQDSAQPQSSAEPLMAETKDSPRMVPVYASPGAELAAARSRTELSADRGSTIRTSATFTPMPVEQYVPPTPFTSSSSTTQSNPAYAPSPSHPGPIGTSGYAMIAPGEVVLPPGDLQPQNWRPDGDWRRHDQSWKPGPSYG